jgi:hypothetical protein
MFLRSYSCLHSLHNRSKSAPLPAANVRPGVLSVERDPYFDPLALPIFLPCLARPWLLEIDVLLNLDEVAWFVVRLRRFPRSSSFILTSFWIQVPLIECYIETPWWLWQSGQVFPWRNVKARVGRVRSIPHSIPLECKWQFSAVVHPHCSVQYESTSDGVSFDQHIPSAISAFVNGNVQLVTENHTVIVNIWHYGLVNVETSHIEIH